MADSRSTSEPPAAAVGFLHTSDVHVPTFRLLLERRAPALAVVDAVDQTMLDDAQQRGITADLRHRLQLRLIDLRNRGASVVLCTCSTLGGAAEQLSETVAIPVVRIDRPMAERAAAIGGRIAVVAAVTSTLAPTRALLAECIAAANCVATLVEAPCLDAWPLFQSGDIVRYIEHIATHARRVAEHADVVVLAQASMAPAVDQLVDLPIPVLCSPASAVETAVALVTDSDQRKERR